MTGIPLLMGGNEQEYEGPGDIYVITILINMILTMSSRNLVPKTTTNIKCRNSWFTASYPSRHIPERG